MVFRGRDHPSNRLCVFGFVLHRPWTSTNNTSRHPACSVNQDFMFVLVWPGISRPVRGMLKYPVVASSNGFTGVGSNLVIAGDQSLDAPMRTVIVKAYEHFDLIGVLDQHMSKRVNLDEMEVYRLI